jgi:hypothetical protein
MAGGALDRGGRFVEAKQGFSGILLGSRAPRWMVPETIIGDIALRHRLYLATKPSHVGVDVDGLAYPMHCPMVYIHQMRGQGFLSDVALVHHAIEGGGAFPGDAKPLSLDI